MAWLAVERLITPSTSKVNMHARLEAGEKYGILKMAREDREKAKRIDMSLSLLILEEGTLSEKALALARELKPIVLGMIGREGFSR